MREIEFRGKSKGNPPDICPDGEWLAGYYTKDLFNGKVEDCIFSCPMALIIDPETLGQFTGLLDKNGNKIFEGDIVTQLLHSEPTEIEGAVKLGYFIESKCAEYTCEHYGWYIDCEWFNYIDNTGHNFVQDRDYISYEIIGNIHDKTGA